MEEASTNITRRRQIIIIIIILTLLKLPLALMSDFNHRIATIVHPTIMNWLPIWNFSILLINLTVQLSEDVKIAFRNIRNIAIRCLEYYGHSLRT